MGADTDIVKRLRDQSGGHINGLYDLEAANEIDRLRASLKRIAHFTSATPGLSESGCGRLLAQIEHEAMKALGRGNPKDHPNA